MNRSVFGKTMENLRKRVDVRLVTNEKKLLELTSKTTYVSSKIFNGNLVAVRKIKEALTLINRPVYLNMCILDLSQTLMYYFNYKYIKIRYGDEAKLLFTEMDSLTYEIRTEDAYKDIWNNKELFDNSDYPDSSPFFDKSNKKIIGKMKDETAGSVIKEFVGLRSKTYSTDITGGKTAKGMKNNVIKKNIKHENYKIALFNNNQVHHRMKTIRSQRHQIGSYDINKVSLNYFDDKMYIEDGINARACGH